jgi:long-chain acyl-CoA synthetase
MSVHELDERAARGAAALRATGARAGGAVAIVLRNEIAFLEALLAAHHLGAYAVPINWHLTTEEVAHILVDCGASHAVVHEDLLPRVREAAGSEAAGSGITLVCVRTPPEVRRAFGIAPEEANACAGHVEWDAWLRCHEPQPRPPAPSGGTMSYTSGTTGRPKGVRRAPVGADRRQAVAEQAQRWFGNRPGMRTAIVGPLYHSVQNSYAIAAVRARSSMVVVAPRFDAEDLLRLIARERLTHLHLVPTMMRRLLDLPLALRERHDVSSLEFVVHGAGPCPPDVKRELIAWFGPVVHEYYGTSEAGMVSRASSQEWLRREGTVGRPWPGRVVRICGDDGAALPPHAEGEVYVSLGLTPDFTYQNAEAERAAIERDGLITCGDVGYLDEEGYLFLCDRKRDMVISGGVNIYPAEIEAAMAGHPAVLDCAVFGVPHDDLGETLMAVVQPRPGAAVTGEALHDWARARLASFKVPRTFEIRESLQRDESGKLRKRLLREPYWAGTGRRI